MTNHSDLFTALASNDLEVLRRALNGCDDPDRGDVMGRTALSVAARQGLIEHLSVLLDSGASPNTADRSGMTPLMHAAYNQHASAVEQLLKAGADPHLRDLSGRTALRHSTVRVVALPLGKRLHGTVFLPRLWRSHTTRLLRRAMKHGTIV